MSTYSPVPVGAIKTRVLVLLIALIVCGVAGTVIVSHFLQKSSNKPDATHAVASVTPTIFLETLLSRWLDQPTKIIRDSESA